MSYEASLKHKRDWQSVLSTTKRKGVDSGIEIGIKKGIEIGTEKGIEIGTEKGIEMGKSEIIKNLIAGLDLSNEEISKMANVSIEFVQQVRENLQNK